ncbi:hypothetical protein D3C80_1840560 [compost metagenome]
MCLAVHHAQALGIDQRRAVGQPVARQAFAKTADDDDVQLHGQRLPQAQGRAVLGFGQGQRFSAVGEHVAALYQLG